jgi:surface polysaccharide O-acyltransferase-like enzyme
MKALQPRTVWVDNIRVAATLAVIIVHVATPPVFTQYDPHGISNTNWWIGNIYDSFCRFCVPVFVMLTGALLIPQRTTLREFLNKRLKRILTPFIFWSLIYLLFNFGLMFRDKGSAALTDLLPWVVTQLTHGVAPHLWYVYMILGIYLFIPIIQPWLITASNKAILFFLGFWILTIIIGQKNIISTVYPLDFRYFSGYLGYLVLGYFISARMSVHTKTRYIAIGVFLLGFLATLWGTYFNTYASGQFSHRFYEYLTINVFLESASLFVIFSSYNPIGHETGIFIKARTIVNKYGYGIYLAHLLVLSLMTHFKIDYSLLTPIVGIPLTALICMLLTCSLVYLLSKLPYGKYISG